MEASFGIRQGVVVAKGSVRLDLGTQGHVWVSAETRETKRSGWVTQKMEMHVKTGSRKGQAAVGWDGMGVPGDDPSEAPRPCQSPILLTLCLTGSPRAPATGRARPVSSTAASRSLQPPEESSCLEGVGTVVLADCLLLPVCLEAQVPLVL